MSIKFKSALVIFAILIAMITLGSLDADEARQQVARYCDNVAIWQATGGNAGWPDYKGNFSEVCK